MQTGWIPVKCIRHFATNSWITCKANVSCYSSKNIDKILFIYLLIKPVLLKSIMPTQLSQHGHLTFIVSRTEIIEPKMRYIFIYYFENQTCWNPIMPTQLSQQSHLTFIISRTEVIEPKMRYIFIYYFENQTYWNPIMPTQLSQQSHLTFIISRTEVIEPKIRYIFIPILCVLSAVDENYRLPDYDAVFICNALPNLWKTAASISKLVDYFENGNSRFLRNVLINDLQTQHHTTDDCISYLYTV